MKNKKGFTLVELLAVIVVLMLILLLAYPNFYKLTDSYKSKYDATTRVLLKNAASMYVNNNIEDIEAYFKYNSDPLCIPIGKLIAYEYLDSDLRDSSGEISKNRCINVTKNVDSTSGEISYIYDTLTTSSISSSTDYLPPVIYMISKDSNDYECRELMNVTNQQLDKYTDARNIIEKFEKFVEDKCEIGAKDNVDGNISSDNITASISLNSNLNRFYMTYNVKDSSGNKAIPLKIELVIKNDNN